MAEIGKMEQQLADEVVLMIYKRAGKIVFYSTVGLGGVSVALSSSRRSLVWES